MDGDGPAGDRDYKSVAQRSDVCQADARKRVDDVIGQAKAATRSHHKLARTRWSSVPPQDHGALAATNIDPIAMLFWTVVINGIVAVPIMIVMMLLITNTTLRSQLLFPAWLKVLGWLSAGLMTLAVGALAWSALVRNA